MSPNRIARWPLALALALGLLASPAAAQGKAKGKDKKQEKERPELVRRATNTLREEYRIDRDDKRDKRDDRWDDRRDDRDDRWDDGRWDGRWEGDRARKDVPPGWCKGKGNPHNTPENCGWDSRRDGRWESRRDDDRRYDDRDGYGSYDREHDEFHRWHDRECRMRAAERPLDIPWQIRVRQECRERHDEWHYRVGRRH